jgi:hypothetical protein
LHPSILIERAILREPPNFPEIELSAGFSTACYRSDSSLAAAASLGPRAPTVELEDISQENLSYHIVVSEHDTMQPNLHPSVLGSSRGLLLSTREDYDEISSMGIAK